MKVRTTNPTPIMAGVLLVMSVGCGAVGSPIPPERVGVNATIERQKALESLEEKRRKDIDPFDRRYWKVRHANRG